MSELMSATESPKLLEDLGELASLVDELKCRSILLIADPVAYEVTGASQIVDELPDSCRITKFQDFQPNPTLDELLLGIEAYEQAQPDAILAIGGGTSIDLGKIIGLCAALPGVSPKDVIVATPKEAEKALPLIAVPTTSGTGSEATHFAAIYVEGVKYSVAHPTLVPDYAFLDPRMTQTMPPSITAAVGLDALCQSIESMWSVGSTQQSREYAAQGMQLAWANLKAAVNAPNPDNRLAMSRAAHFAGKAINISKTTAPHAISYSFTANYNVPHGQAVALTLGAILVFNSQVTDADCNDPRGVDFVRQRIDEVVAMLGFPNVQAAQQGIREFVAAIHCPTQLSQVGVNTDEQIEEIARSVNLERVGNNPRRFDNESLQTLLKSIR